MSRFCHQTKITSIIKTPIIILFLLLSAASARAQFFTGIDAKAGASNIISFEGDKNKTSFFVGIHAGYEIFKHIPVSIGVEYGKFKSEFSMDETESVRLPLMIGYNHYVKRLVIFADAGIFMSIMGKNRITFIDSNGTILGDSYVHAKKHLGIIGRVGFGYLITEKIRISAAFEYSRPFKEFENVLSHQYSGASMSANYYF
jgi:hypothetical protein